MVSLSVTVTLCYGLALGLSVPAPGCRLTYLPSHTLIVRTTGFSGSDGIYAPGSTIKVVCKAGYVARHGDEERTCRDGQWTGYPLICRRKIPECPAPVHPVGGYITSGKDDNGRVEIRYSCFRLLTLVGESYSRCLADGTWSVSTPPTCQRRHACADPGEKPNAIQIPKKQFEVADFGPSDAVEYRCEPGYLIDGLFDRQEMICLWGGEWVTEQPGACEAVTCAPPERPNNGWYLPQKSNYGYQETVTYECEEKHDMIGPATLTCDRYGQWSTHGPVCRGITCPYPNHPEHGRMIGSSFSVGDTVSFECVQGYQLRGSRNRTCLPNAQWSGFLTICDWGDSDCPDPGTPIGAIKEGNSYNVGDTVSFTCGSDFVLEGSASRMCLRIGMWSGMETFCRYKYSYTDPAEAAVLFSEKLDRLSVETSDSQLGSQLRQNVTVTVDESTGRAINIGHQFGVDLYLVVDVSGSISAESLNITKAFCKAVVEKVGVSRKIDGTRVTVISFSGKIEQLSIISDEQTPEALLKKIDQIDQIEGSKSTATAIALTQVEDYIATRRTQSLGRKALSAVILLTDGHHNTYGSPVTVANRMKEEHEADLYTIGIGTDVNDLILKEIASPGQYVRLKYVTDLAEITNFVLNGSIGYEECGIGGLRNLPAVKDALTHDYVTARDIKNWPWMARLFLTDPYQPRFTGFQCGASLIRPQWLLTAAHCFTNQFYHRDPSLWEARMGSLTRSKPDGIPLSVSDIILYPDKRNGLLHDLALVKLTEPVLLSPTIRTICLPDDLSMFHYNRTQQWYREDQWSVVAGWGDVRQRKIKDKTKVVLQEEMKFVGMAIKSDEDCENSITDHSQYTQDLYCAGDGLNRDSCAGDSGGPSMIEIPIDNHSKRVFQVGIVSFGFGCRQEGKFGFYTRLEPFLPWVFQTMEES